MSARKYGATAKTPLLKNGIFSAQKFILASDRKFFQQTKDFQILIGIRSVKNLNIFSENDILKYNYI
jgi:hypothetical protein